MKFLILSASILLCGCASKGTIDFKSSDADVKNIVQDKLECDYLAHETALSQMWTNPFLEPYDIWNSCMQERGYSLLGK